MFFSFEYFLVSLIALAIAIAVFPEPETPDSLVGHYSPHSIFFAQVHEQEPLICFLELMNESNSSSVLFEPI